MKHDMIIILTIIDARIRLLTKEGDFIELIDINKHRSVLIADYL